MVQGTPLCQLVRIEVTDQPLARQQQGRCGLTSPGVARRNASRKASITRRVGQQNSEARRLKRILAGYPEQSVRQRRQKRPLGRERVNFGLHLCVTRLLRSAPYCSFGGSWMSIRPRLQEGHSRSEEVIYVARHRDHAGSPSPR